jgi:triphosphoribosyl-dephospho-CoA synthase
MDAALAAHTACVWEVLARKVGNVHPRANFTDLTYLDFIHSASTLMKALVEGDGVGETILRAVQLRQEVTPSNTNLGIILLLVPLAKSENREHLKTILASLTINDARFAFEAIRTASAGGLGTVPEQSVAEEPTMTLLEAMRLAEDRDMIAKQYATGYADIFDFGVPNLLQAFEYFGCIEAAIIECQLHWLAEYPDSLIARKCGMPTALEVQTRTRAVLTDNGLVSTRGRASCDRLDAYLRSDGNRLNPGTTADLVTACLFIALRENKLKTTNFFPWLVTNWL